MSSIVIRGARLRNLKNVSLSIPKNQLVLFTGVSGSGKSTMAFDTLHTEGQRQYMESLGMVTYANRPPLDSIAGLSPSISVDQGLTNRSPRSTVGTATEVFTYLRVLFARVGHRPCPRCGKDVPPAHEGGPEAAWDDEGGSVSDLGSEPAGGDAEGAISCPHCGAPLPEMGMAMFSFNKPDGACPTCTGLGSVFSPDLPRLLDETKSILEGAVNGWDATYLIPRNVDTLRAAARHYGFDFDPTLPVGQYGQAQRDLLIYGVQGAPFTRHFPGKQPPPTVLKGYFEGVFTTLLRRHAEHASDAEYLEKIERLLVRQVCPDCGGARLRAEARAVTVLGRHLVAGVRPAPAEAAPQAPAISHLPLAALADWIDELPAALSPEDWLVAEPIVIDLRERVHRLVEVGLGYLTLDRATPSLAAGEAQRLRLAALLGSGLTGVLYVLDEPTVGLHGRDNPRLVKMLRALRDLGNTVLVIEHDMEVVAAADWMVDFGPGGGRNGGQIVAEGSPQQVAASPASLTGQYLSGAAETPVPARRRQPDGTALTIHGAPNTTCGTSRCDSRSARWAAGPGCCSP